MTGIGHTMSPFARATPEKKRHVFVLVGFIYVAMQNEQITNNTHYNLLPVIFLAPIM